MSRANELLSLYEALYRCTECGNTEASEDMMPKDMMQGADPICSQCGSVTEAVWGHTTIPGSTGMPDMTHGHDDSGYQG